MDEVFLDLIHQVRKQVWRNGYRPIPILSPDSGEKGAGKRPAGSGPNWSRWEKDARQDPPHAANAKPAIYATNTGIAADGLCPVDGDIDDPVLAEVIDRLAVEMLGDAPKRYRDDSPRWLRLYRAAKGEPPHAEVLEDEAVAAAAGRFKPFGVEVLGKGNQFVAIGHHPDGAFLDWADGRSPITVARNDLPAVSEAQITDFLSVVGELLGSKKSRQNRRNPPPGPMAADSDRTSGGSVAGDGDTALADVQAALAMIPGDGGSYKTWIRVGMAIYAATNGSPDGWSAYDQWSQKSFKYVDANAVEKVWRTFRPNALSFGTLVHMAREVDPAWRAPSWNQRNSDPDVGAAAGTPVPITTHILNRNVAPPPSLPLAVFGAECGEWIQQAAGAANAPPDYVATSLLAVAGSLIGNARWGQAWSGWAEPSVLWCALVGEPSASKTPAANAVLRLLRQVEADMAEGFDEIYAAWEEAAARAKSERKQWEASVAMGDDTPMPRSAVPPEPMRPLASTSSVTVEKVAAMMQGQPRGFLVANDELAGWLNNMERYSNGTDRPFWLQAWTGSPYRVDRKSSATAIIPCLSLAIFGTIQPDRLATALKGADDGLPARFLFCWPEARPFARPRGTVNVSRATEALCKLARLTHQSVI